MTHISRNQPCPCGSGKKFKRCCGVAAASSSPSPRRPPPAAGRPCGDCAACCLGWVKTKVNGVHIDVGRPCPHTDGRKCLIHEQRPQEPCRNFFCGWAQAGSLLPDWLQPNRSGVIVITDRIHWQGRNVDILVSAGRDPDAGLIDWYQRFSIRHGRPFIYQRREQWYAFGPQAFQRCISAKVAAGEPLWEGDHTAAAPRLFS